MSDDVKTLPERMVEEVEELRQTGVAKPVHAELDINTRQGLRSVLESHINNLSDILLATNYEKELPGLTAFANIVKQLNEVRRHELKEMEVQLQAKKIAIEANRDTGGNIMDVWLMGPDDE